MTTTSTGDGAWTSVVGAVDISDNVVIAHDVTLDGNVDMTGNLTINSGKSLDTTGSNHNLTVSGHVSVDGTLTGNASAISVGSMIINSGGTYSATSGTTTVTSENASHAFRCSGGGTFTNNNGTLEIQTAAQTRLKMNGTGNVHHLTVNNASCQLHMESDSSTTVEGNLTITAGIVNTNTEGGASRNFTVAGTSTIGPNSGAADQATLTCNASTISLGSGITSSAYGLYVNQGGTFTGGSGTHTLGSVVVRNNAAAKCTLSSGVTTINGEHGGDGRAINIEGTSATFDDANGTVTFTFAGTTKIALEGNSLYNVIVNDSSASVEYIGNTTIDNDLTVTAGKFRYNNFHDLTVTGDVSVTGILGHPTTTTTSDSTFGSLTINSGGEYKAPSGTTTITTATGAGSSSNRAAFCHASGTFTHNNGLFKTTAGNADVEFTSQSETNNPFYDFEATQYAIAATSPWVVLNNMTIANGFQFNGSGGYAKVLGIMKHTGGTYNASDVSSSTSHFFNHYRLEGGTLDLSNIDITVGSIRNTGGTIS